MWKQRSKVQWFVEGDRNTRYFHACASQRAKRNEVTGLENSEGVFCEANGVMGQIVNDYFANISSSRNHSSNEIDDVVETMESIVNGAINEDLCRILTRDEVKKAFFDMYPLKSPALMVC